MLLEPLAELAAACCSQLGVVADAELSLTLVDPTAIADLNERYMGKAGPTDVLSFPVDDPDHVPAGAGGPPQMLGDIVICPEVAATNAPDHAGTLEDELALLVVHGVLHLLGHDHIDHADAVRMHQQERSLLAALHRPVDLPEHRDTIGPAGDRPSAPGATP
ncbi:MAG: rRNA maturation RNase YbeY [Acidimicrobiales bacterium]|nr:rRNA maturation RNase YbeY [Acidimicrobiales bacterium]